MKILLVEDSKTMRKILRRSLVELGYATEDIFEAGDGGEALEQIVARRFEVDVVLADWNMPNVDGLTFVQRLQATEPGRALPVIMVTSESQREKVIEAITSGARDYMIKPFSIDTLRQKMRAVEKEAPSRREQRRTATRRIRPVGGSESEVDTVMVRAESGRSSESGVRGAQPWAQRERRRTTGVRKQDEVDELTRRETSVMEEAPTSGRSSTRIDSGLSGMLSAMSVSEVVQVLHESRKTGTLRIHGGGATGRVYFDKGEIRQARLGDKQGEDAFYEMLGFTRGTFAFEAGESAVKPDISQPTMTLLMEGLRRQDEQGRS